VFDTTRMHLKGQLVAARDLDWDGDLYVIIPRSEAEKLLPKLEVEDASVDSLDSSSSQCPHCLRSLGTIT
jgi:hypothetical protein